MTKILLAIVLSANIFFTFAKADDEIPQANEIIENPDQQNKIAQVSGQTELNQINDKNILSPEYTGVLQSGKLHYGVGITYEIRQKLVKLACGLTLPQFEFMISDAATKLTNKSFNDATLRILAEDIVATGVGAKDNNRMQQNSNERISALKQNVANNVLQSVNSGSVRLINQGVLKAAMSLDKPYSCRNRIAIDHFQALANEMKSKNIQAYQKFLQMFKFNCSYCEDQYSASVKIAQLQASSEHSDNNNVAMGQVTGLVIYTSGIGIKNPPLAAGIAVFGGVGIVAYWTSKEAKINNIESASKELAKTQFEMCKNDCSNTSDAQAAKESKEKYNKGSDSVSKEFNSTNRLSESENLKKLENKNSLNKKKIK
jgi:outer membrane murein-binding lipoprotein Lpp